MKKNRYFANGPAAKAVCTVSAAALMLGASHAATVGFNFQANYCAAASYSGAVVTATAFGVASNAWQSLTAADTGYACSGGCALFNLSELIDTNTATGGLNPLPNGSLTVTWSASSANVSGFAGYGGSGFPYEVSGVNYKPGSQQVYWGFLRDGVNFGPVPPDCGSAPSGDNSQPGYQIDITGLKTLFTNTPFAVQLIASSDSAWSITNAFIIDATLSVTQSVSYPSLAPIRDQQNAMMPRGIGGGLSEASGAFDSDHLKIIGNRAQHGSTFNNASTIAGFIITDKPVISMSPNSLLASGADSFTLGGYAVGVPPLAYQWRKNGVPIPGATATTFGITNVAIANAGRYDLVVTNLYGQATSEVAEVIIDRIVATPTANVVVDSNPHPAKHDGLSFGSAWLASSDTRAGVMSFNGTNSQITVPGQTNLDYPLGAIMFYVSSAGLVDSAGPDATLFDRLTNSFGLALTQTSSGKLHVQAAGSANDFSSVSSALNDGAWHHVAIVFDQTTGGMISLYIDGVPDNSNPNASAWSWPAGQQLEFGLSHDSSWQAYSGLMDDIRLYNRILSEAEVAQAATGAIVDPDALILQLNFDSAPSNGVILRWLCPDAVLQSSNTIDGTYISLPAATAPLPVPAIDAQKFYRYKGHTPANLFANPYLM